MKDLSILVTLDSTVTRKVQTELRKRIKGTIYVTSYNDRLICEITGYDNITFHTEVKNLYHKASTGITCYDIAQDILTQYINYVLSRHFRGSVKKVILT